MSKKEVEHIRRFTAHDENGTGYDIDEYQDFIIAESRAGSSRLPGMRSFKTSNGYHVNLNGKGQYHIVELGIDVTSGDSDAP
jgi:hypothetical protein